MKIKEIDFDCVKSIKNSRNILFPIKKIIIIEKETYHINELEKNYIIFLFDIILIKMIIGRKFSFQFGFW